MKRNTWVVVANRAGAKFFLHQAIGQPLSEIESFENPAGKLRATDLVSDKQGSSYNANAALHHNSYSTPVDPKKNVLDKFAREVAEKVNKSAYEGKFERLVIAAEPSMLGELRGFLDKHSTEKIVVAVDKDLLAFKPGEIVEHLASAVRL